MGVDPEARSGWYVDDFTGPPAIISSQVVPGAGREGVGLASSLADTAWPREAGDLRFVCPACHKAFAQGGRKACPDPECGESRPADGWWLLPRLFRDDLLWQYQLGRGGMGAVYLTEDVTQAGDPKAASAVVRTVPGGVAPASADAGRFFALKVARASKSETLREHFAHEMKVAPDLYDRAPEHFVRIHENSERFNPPYMLMEYVPWPTLTRLLGTTPLRPTRAARIVRALALALEVAHKADVVHCDLKPDNLFVSEGLDPGGSPLARVKVNDFGGFCRVGKKAKAGTPAYASPEQLAGHTLDGRADLWATSVILWRMVTGQRPVPPVDVAEVSGRLAPLLRRALAPDIADRYANAAELGAALDAFLAGEAQAIRARVEAYRSARSRAASELDRLRARVEQAARAVHELDHVSEALRALPAPDALLDETSDPSPELDDLRRRLGDLREKVESTPAPPAPLHPGPPPPAPAPALRRTALAGGLGLAAGAAVASLVVLLLLRGVTGSVRLAAPEARPDPDTTSGAAVAGTRHPPNGVAEIPAAHGGAVVAGAPEAESAPVPPGSGTERASSPPSPTSEAAPILSPAADAGGGAAALQPPEVVIETPDVNGALVTVDGRACATEGGSSCRLRLDGPGPYVLRILAEGFEPWPGSNAYEGTWPDPTPRAALEARGWKVRVELAPAAVPGSP